MVFFFCLVEKETEREERGGGTSLFRDHLTVFVTLMSEV